MRDKILKYINEKYNYPKHLAAARIKQLLCNGEILNYCNDFLSKNTNWKNYKNILLGIFYHFNEPLKCITCGKNVSIEKTIKAYKHKYFNVFCCINCITTWRKQNKDLLLEKSKNTCIKKYGVDNPSKFNPIQEKIKQTFIKKYGVDNPWKSEDIKRKIKNKFKEKYGSENIQIIPEIKEKIIKTNLLKYGVEHPLQNKEILEKMKNTNLQKYGVEFSLQNKDIFKKAKETFFKNYGEYNSSKNENRKLSVLENGWKTILGWKDYIIPLFTKEEYLGGNKGIIYKWKCVKCGNEFEQELKHCHCEEIKNLKGYQNLPRCLKCYPKINNGYSKKEKELLNFIKSIYHDEIIENDRTLIKPYELDIVLPKIKLAIEFNGTYWHIEGYTKPLGYHKMKMKMVTNINYDLIYIWEDDWNNNIKIKDNLKNEILKRIK